MTMRRKRPSPSMTSQVPYSINLACSILSLMLGPGLTKRSMG